MCGRFNATFDSGLRKLYTRLNINKVIDKPIDKAFVKAADTVSIVRNNANHRVVENAIWWLLLDQTADGFKPSKYTSFNTRFDKLNTPNSAGFHAFRHSRCIIAVKGFGETEFKNKKPVHYYNMTASAAKISNTDTVFNEALAVDKTLASDITLKNQALAGGLLLGGLSRDWRHNETGEIKTSCSVITLPPHQKLQHIHSKAMPLILPQNSQLIDQWLDNQFTDVEQFTHLLSPHIPQNLIAQQIDKPMTHNSIGAPQLILQD